MNEPVAPVEASDPPSPEPEVEAPVAPVAAEVPEEVEGDRPTEAELDEIVGMLDGVEHVLKCLAASETLCAACAAAVESGTISTPDAFVGCEQAAAVAG